MRGFLSQDSDGLPVCVWSSQVFACLACRITRSSEVILRISTALSGVQGCSAKGYTPPWLRDGGRQDFKPDHRELILGTIKGLIFLSARVIPARHPGESHWDSQPADKSSAERQISYLQEGHTETSRSPEWKKKRKEARSQWRRRGIPPAAR